MLLSVATPSVDPCIFVCLKAELPRTELALAVAVAYSVALSFRLQSSLLPTWVVSTSFAFQPQELAKIKIQALEHAILSLQSRDRILEIKNKSLEPAQAC